MATRKVIRAAAMHLFQRDEIILKMHMEQMERFKPSVRIRYDRGNIYDATCMVILENIYPIAFVNKDDKPLVEPLLRDSEFCTAEFLDIYCEEEQRPTVRFTVEG